MCYAGTPFFEAIEEMYKKIRPSLPKKNVEFFSQIREGFAAPSRVLLDHGSHYKTIQKITKAILASYMLAFTLFLLYRNTKEDRSVDRYSLQVYEESIYLVGYCHSRKEIRALAVQRMENVTVTDRAFTAKEEFSLDEYLAQPFNVFSGDAHKVVMGARLRAEFVRGQGGLSQWMK